MSKMMIIRILCKLIDYFMHVYPQGGSPHPFKRLKSLEYKKKKANYFFIFIFL